MGLGLQVAGSGNVGTSGQELSAGYLVESDGKIQLPYLGKVQAEGLTRLQLEVNLTELFKEYTKTL